MNPASFYVTGGTLRPDAPSYVERRADHELHDALLHGQFCYVLTSRQMGKSSLMVRTANRLRAEGINVAVLDLTAIGKNLTAEQWYDGLLVSLGRQLRLEDELEEFWQTNPRLSPAQRFFSGLRDCVLLRRAGELVIFVDEIDAVRSLPFSTDEFFAGIREFYNRRADDEISRQVTFCLLGVATPADLIRDARTTPFNIGRRIELNDFTPVEAAPLARGLARDRAGRPADEDRVAARLLERVLYWTNGHPYLTQRLCHAIVAAGAASRPTDVDRVCEGLFLSARAREQDDNLLFVRDRLLNSESDLAELLMRYRSILRAPRQIRDAANSRHVGVLRLAGVVREQDGFLEVRNRIYSHVFDRDWVERHIPEAEKRRQRDAFRRGMIRASLVGGVVLGAVTWLALHALRQSRDYSALSVQALASQARVGRLSGLAGQRFEGLKALGKAARIARDGDEDEGRRRELRDEAIQLLTLADLRLDSPRLELPSGGPPLAFAPDFNRYARSDARGDVRVLSFDGGMEPLVLSGDGSAASRAWFDSTGERLAVAYSGPRGTNLIVWNLADRTRLFEWDHPVLEEAFDFSRSNRIALGGTNGTVHIVDLSSRRVAVSFAAAPGSNSPTCLRFNHDGTLLAIGGRQRLRLQIRRPDNRETPPLVIQPGRVQTLAWHPSEDLLAVGADGETVIRLLRFSGLNLVTNTLLGGHRLAPSALAFGLEGQLLASTGPDHLLKLWDPLRAQCLVTLPDSSEWRQLRFSRDSRRLGFPVKKGGVALGVVEPAGDHRRLITVGAHDVRGLDFAAGGRLLCVATGDGLLLFDGITGRRLGAVSTQAVEAVAYNPRREELLASDAGGVRAFPVRTVRSGDSTALQIGRSRLIPAAPAAGHLVVAEGGGALAVWRDGNLRVIDPANGELRMTRSGALGTPTYALSPNGRWLCGAETNTSELLVWLVEGSDLLRRLPIKGAAQPQFSRGGRWLAASTERGWQVWSTETWKSVAGHKRDYPTPVPQPLALSPDERLLAYVSDEMTVQLVSLPSSRVVATLPVSDDGGPVTALRFSPGGGLLAAASGGDTIAVWNLANLRVSLLRLELDWDGPALRLPPQHAWPLRVEMETDGGHR